jgi:hypothetical protein
LRSIGIEDFDGNTCITGSGISGTWCNWELIDDHGGRVYDLLDHGVGFAGSGVAMLSGRLLWGHDALIAAFVDASLGRRDNPVPLGDALAVAATTDDLLAAIGARERAPAQRTPGA